MALHKLVFSFGLMLQLSMGPGLLLSGNKPTPLKFSLAAEQDEPIYVHDDVTNEHVELQTYLKSRLQLRPMKPALSLMNNGRAQCIKRVALFHIPKTGGRTVSGVLQHVLQQVLNVSGEDALAMGGVNEAMKDIAGNEPYVVEFHTTQAKPAQMMPVLKKLNAEDDCGVIAAIVLRDPVNRLVSNFNYNMESTCLPPTARPHMLEYAERNNNVQTRFQIASKWCPTCRAFWKDKLTCPPLDRDDLQLAKSLINDMDVVGVTEDLTSFVQDVLRKMGIDEDIVKNVFVPVAGKTKVGTNETVASLSKMGVSTLRKGLAYDEELYSIARTRATSHQ